jgi:hypothetical protein
MTEKRMAEMIAYLVGKPRPALFALCLLGAASPVEAHHSFAMFDPEHPVHLEGTVKTWEFTNPHSWLVLTVMKDGKPVQYSIEGSSVNTLARQHFGVHTFAPGENISITMSPLRDGGNGGAFVKAIKADGTVLTQSPTPN